MRNVYSFLFIPFSFSVLPVDLTIITHIALLACGFECLYRVVVVEIRHTEMRCQMPPITRAGLLDTGNFSHFPVHPNQTVFRRRKNN